MSATAILNLSKAGFTEAQVTALAEYLDEQAATKADIAELNGAIEKVRFDLGRDIEKLRADLELRIAGVDLKIAGVEVKIADAKADTIKWVVGLLIAQGAAIVALIKLLPGAH